MRKNKNLLLISYPYEPNSSAGAVRSERLASYLVSVGWDVDVVTIRPRSDTFQDTGRRTETNHLKVNRTATFDPWLKLQGWRPTNIILRALRSIGLRIFSFPDHMLCWIPFVVREGLKIHQTRGFCAVYTTSPPHSTHLSGLILSKITRKPLVVDFRDPWTLNTYTRKNVTFKILRSIERLMEKMVLKRAAIILANTRANQSRLCEAFPHLTLNKVHYLPNGWQSFDLPLVQSLPDDIFTIVHAGTFYPDFKPYAMLIALAAWKKGQCSAETAPFKGLQVKLLGCNDEVTKKLIQDLELSDVVSIAPWMPLAEARKVMCEADALWVTLGTGEGASTYVPSKLFEYIAARRPILGFFPDGEAANLIKDTGTGFVFHSDDSAPVIRVLADAVQSKKEGNLYPIFYQRNEQEINKLDIAVISKRFRSLLESVV